MADLEGKEIWGDQDEAEMQFMLEAMGTDEIRDQIAYLTESIQVTRGELQKLKYDTEAQRERLKDNEDKIKRNSQLPHLVANVVEILEVPDEEVGEEGSGLGRGSRRSKEPKTRQTAVIKTTTRQTIFLPMIGLVPAKEMKPGDLVGCNKDNYIIVEKLPAEYDSRVKAMELDEKPQEDYSDIGGLDKQIQELKEAVELPLKEADKFVKVGITPPKGVLMHGPPGTGKTMLARACAKNTDAIFLKLAGPQLVQMYIGDGAKMVRDAFALAKEKSKDRGGAIIFIDEIDAIGTKRFESDQSGDREVQRTMLELLNQLDGFSSDERIKVIAATNRPDILDPALLRSGRLDRKIELPHPNEKARAEIMRIHSTKLHYDKEDVNFDELARSTDDFNGAQLKAVCIEAGMIALRNGKSIIKHEDYVEGISAVQMKKKASLQYYA